MAAKVTPDEARLIGKIRQIWNGRKGKTTIVIQRDQNEITISDTTPKGKIPIKS